MVFCEKGGSASGGGNGGGGNVGSAGGGVGSWGSIGGGGGGGGGIVGGGGGNEKRSSAAAAAIEQSVGSSCRSKTPFYKFININPDVNEKSEWPEWARLRYRASYDYTQVMNG